MIKIIILLSKVNQSGANSMWYNLTLNNHRTWKYI